MFFSCSCGDSHKYLKADGQNSTAAKVSAGYFLTPMKHHVNLSHAECRVRLLSMAGWGLYQSLTPSLPQLVKFHCMSEGLITDCNSSDEAMEKKINKKILKTTLSRCKTCVFLFFLSVGESFSSRTV